MAPIPMFSRRALNVIAVRNRVRTSEAVDRAGDTRGLRRHLVLAPRAGPWNVELYVWLAMALLGRSCYGYGAQLSGNWKAGRIGGEHAG